MVRIEPFEVEQWMDKYETIPGVLNIAETCAASISLNDLESLCEDPNIEAPLTGLSSRKLTYGPIRGSDALRERLASLYYASAFAIVLALLQPLRQSASWNRSEVLNDWKRDKDMLGAARHHSSRNAHVQIAQELFTIQMRISKAARVPSRLLPSNILITPGAIAANFLLFYTLLGPADHVICVYPTYQQLYSVPESLGASVTLWKLRKEKKYVPDVDELKDLIKENTKMIILNNPNNPTGATIPKSVLQDIIDLARSHDIIIFSDEVYRPLFHSISPVDPDFPPSLISMGYSKTIITGSMSKAYSLAGVRLGWIASRDPAIIEAVAAARDYTTISVSQLDDQVAAYALSGSVIHALLGRNIKLAKTNLALLDAFVSAHSSICSWVKPTGGTTAFIKFERNRKVVDDVQFCIDVLEKTKVMFLPGSKCFGPEFKGFVRIGFVCETAVLQEALRKLDEFLAV